MSRSLRAELVDIAKTLAIAGPAELGRGRQVVQALDLAAADRSAREADRIAILSQLVGRGQGEGRIAQRSGDAAGVKEASLALHANLIALQ